MSLKSWCVQLKQIRKGMAWEDIPLEFFVDEMVIDDLIETPKGFHVEKLKDWREIPSVPVLKIC